MSDQSKRKFLSVRTGGKGFLFRLSFVFVCFVLIAAGTAALHVRASLAPEARANPPITVQVETVDLISSYRTEETFVGRVEPARQTLLGFELSGLVTLIAVDEGDKVKTGELVAQLDTDKLLASRDALRAERKEVKARRDLASATLMRQRELRSEGWQTEQRYDEARFSVSALTAAIERLDAAIEAIDIDIDKSSIFAPFDGVIGARLLDEGAVPAAGAPLVNVLENGRRRARVGVSVDAASDLKVGSSQRVLVSGRDQSARIIALRPDLHEQTRTLTVILELEDEIEVPFGELVELAIDREVESEGAWVPIGSMNEGKKGVWTVLTVQMIDGDLRVQREAVEVLHVDAERAFVRGTLEDNDLVIIGGTNRIVPGQVVLVSGEAP